ncbi:MAG: maltose alpha-D-glucosyltransferase [Acidobacteria bacterium]|nr:maltose alpha-D-glucosyltransferase [Acidobacteriota bacterium]
MEEFVRPPQPDWYKDAVIYQVHVRSFFDGNDDGIGDFAGLVQKLDYLQALGINTLWILPFYPSPLRDDGYDIAHYQGVHPGYGTLRDVRRFLREAHARSLRVITELVMNHTSDQHPWFQAARHAPPGSPARDFYVWSDSDRTYDDVRIIFTDTETSNWTWDPVAKAYYWHRFFHHQPDLNYDNPRVLRAMLRAMRFWLDLGVDAFRLDAIPYLIEREGTSCESLPETHAIIRQVRRFVDSEYPGRVLLAEANQWPADVSAYFGAGDECQMAFHFPLMPRLYMAIEREDREPIVEILRQTPEIPESCQWALFLRNHDELTLEMVTPEEREYMYGAYAEDPRMRINVGIRRRLAPLLDNDRRRVELLNVLLLSLPGTPVIYYGDEIGMGDNIYLSDRHGVRTPMQWTGDRNGGFSRADPQRLCAPPVMDPVFGFQAVNVESQERSPASLLHWMRRMIAMRQAHRTFGRGSIEFVETGNRRVLAFTRTLGDDTVLVVANLSGQVQTAQVQTTLDGVPVELLGRSRLPALDRGRLFLTLSPYGWYWLHMVPTGDARAHGEAAADVRRHPMPDLLVSERWDTLLDGPGKAVLERRYLRPYLEQQPWYRAPGAVIRQIRIASHALLRDGAEPIALVAVDVEGEIEVYRYGLVLTFTGGPRAEELLDRHPGRVLARIGGARAGVLHEVIEVDAVRALMRAFTDGTSVSGRDGVFDVASKGPAVLADHQPYVALPTSLGQTVIACGAAAEIKIRRRLLRGRSHEQRLLATLANDLDLELPVVYATLDLRTPDGERWPFMLLRSRVPFTDDGWDRSLQLALRWLAEPRPLPDTDPFVWLRDGREIPQVDSEPLHEARRMATTLGRRVAATHVAYGQELAANPVTQSTSDSRDREHAEAALAALPEIAEAVRGRWALLLASPSADRILDSRQMLGGLARWRWLQDEPSPVDADDSTPGVVGEAADYGERDIGALVADLAYVAVTALQQIGRRDLRDPSARGWWAVVTAALVKGWLEELAATGRATLPIEDVVSGLRVGLLWRLLVDAVAASEPRRQMARAVLLDLAAQHTGEPA